MSADNWTICPKCKGKENKCISDLKIKLKKMYGKVSSEKYLEIREKLKDKESALENQENFREDYEIGINGGKFYVNYSGSCEECGFVYSFKKNEKIKL